MTGKDYDDDFSGSVSIGRMRRRLPVAAKIAFVTAGIAGRAVIDQQTGRAGVAAGRSAERR
jgi:hypothetical protein